MDVGKKSELVKVLLLIIVVTCILSVPTSAFALSSSKNAVKTASVTIGVYRDQGCKHTLASINWGGIYPSSTVNVSGYIRNLGTVPVTIQMSAVNWNPLNSWKYLLLSWNYSGQPIKPNEVVPITFKLAVSENAQNLGTFSFVINILSFG